ncbi:MAG TPA: DUF1385 domain-containing protein [Abditibacteriaceae bacterium]|jgi:uncharacterized protein YqhQ|nr:DUF1385 domain-containing protein [Abditibacteriaceae bacterium]
MSQSKPDAAIPLWLFALTVAGSFAIGLGLFVALPSLLALQWTQNFGGGRFVHTGVEGVVKLAIFVAYVWLIGRRKHIKRLFEYHGAEHKLVYANEYSRPLTPEGARDFPTPHPRCGTGFALLTVFVSVILFTFLPLTDSRTLQVVMRLALMPLVAGVSYEIIKLTLHPRWGGLVQKLMIPGLWLQLLTTRQPDDAQLEVSCAAMKAVLQAEEELAAGQSSTR